MSDGNTVPLTQPAPVSTPPPVPVVDTSTTQVITPDVLPPLVPAGPPVVAQPVTAPPDAFTAVPAPPVAGTPVPVPPVAAPPGVTAPGVTTGTPAPATDPAATQVVTTDPAGANPAAAVPAGASFTAAAQTDLAKATTALDAVDKNQVKLDLDKQAVQSLLKLITQARGLVDSVHTKAVNSLDVELQFGKNWVGEAISRRLREVAVGNDASAVRVIGDFMQVLFEVEETIRDAARNLEDADDDAANAFNSAGEVRGS
ncbi:hypothetical protein ABZ816_41680 [Actinosynnema sp. NPDC047251]|uniref:Uncharacterized protein n=1 Tax=Saccharothrix espanaensis (strain ATCC 51144 / DSM 44229 / JCM 9112 / NBRC 15066 / NRRL 15764) TaxID=1179773 RepID=K0JPX3_SACES|nr:hypothetical protein [Saccharothrix espanaensis]CCH27521.1 hypothetical protein BN6_01880 [Saccharothrix espanaensis DSM 44229]